MVTYKELKAQMAELQVQLTAARQAEFRMVLEDIQAKVAEYGFTEDEIFGRRCGGSQTLKSVSRKISTYASRY